MAAYRLYCFAQSGNAYKAALMLNLCGADWEARFVDFFSEREQYAGVPPDQRDGRGPRPRA